MTFLAKLFPNTTIPPRDVGATPETYGKYEMPPFEVVDAFADVEVRAYAPHLMADVVVEGSARGARSKGFRILAKYIFGGNTAKTTIEMTAPVAQKPAGSQMIAMTAPVAQMPSDGKWQVSFMMPSKWTRETLPEPQTDKITFREVAPHREAVVAFTGFTSDDLLEEAEHKLRAALEEKGLKVAGPVRHYFHDAPMTPPWKRRNEVALPLED